MDVATFTSHRRSLATDAGDIAYTEFGTGPTALFVHGLGTNGALWRHVVGRLGDTTRCIAVDLPLHGGTPPRDDVSVTGMAAVLGDLCAGLGLGPVDLVANDTGGAVAQVFAARNPELLRTFTLTNCDTDGNFPPPSFAPVVEMAARGELAPMLAQMLGNADAIRASALGAGFERPDRIADEELLAYAGPVAGTPERARHFERILAALRDADDLKAVDDRLRALNVPTLLVWGTGDEAFGIEWAHRLKDTIPGVTKIVEVDGAKVFFPAERPDELVGPLRAHWGR